MKTVNRPQCVCYSAMPIAKTTFKLFDSMFVTLDFLSEKYDVTLLSTTKKQCKYFTEHCSNNVKSLLITGITQGRDKCTYYDTKAMCKFINENFSNVEILYIFGFGMIKIKAISKMLDQLNSEDEIKITFNSSTRFYMSADILRSFVKCFPEINVYDRIIDFWEPDIRTLISGKDITLLAYYDNDKYSHIYDIEYQKFHNEAKAFANKDPKPSKDYTFVFGYTAPVATRKALSNFVQDHIVEDDQHLLFAKDKYWRSGERDDFLSSYDYYDKIEHAKFTIVAPATVPTELSYERIYESIIRDCVPLFMKTVDCDKCFEDDFCKFAKSELTYDQDKYTTVNDFIKTLDYDTLISKIKNMKSIKHLYKISKNDVLKVFEK